MFEEETESTTSENGTKKLRYSKRTSMRNSTSFTPNSPPPKLLRSARKYHRNSSLLSISEENETELSSPMQEKRVLRSRSLNRENNDIEKPRKSYSVPSVVISSPPVSPIKTRSRRKYKPIVYSDNSQLEESEELDDPEFRASTPITPISPVKNTKKKVLVKKQTTLKFHITSSDDDDEADDEDDFEPVKSKSKNKTKPASWKKKITRKPKKAEFSPIRKCPDDFIELFSENPENYLKANLRSYDGSTSAENEFNKLKRINEMRNVEIPPKRKAGAKKNDKKINMLVKKINEEFSDIEKNYELCVESV